MLLLANQTIGVKIPPYLNNGEYLEALEVFKLPKRVTYYAAKLPDSYINSKVLIRIKCTPKGNLATRYSILAGLHIGEKQYYAANDTHGYWNPARTEYEKFFIDTLSTNRVAAVSNYTNLESLETPEVLMDYWYVEADIYRIV